MPVNVGLFGNRVFAEEIKDLQMQSSGFGVSLHPMTGILTEKGGRSEAQRKGHVKTGRYWSNEAPHERNANGGEQTIGEKPGTDSPQSLQGGHFHFRIRGFGTVRG